jgi:putative pyruvate formate lyase activating enzyme
MSHGRNSPNLTTLQITKVQLDDRDNSCSMALLSRLRPTVKPFQSRTAPVHRVSPPQSSRRSLYLAPPYLLDDYIPRYQLLSSIDAAKKRSLAYAHLRECNLCPRLCGVNRYEKTGVCMIGAETVKVNTIAPHFAEGRCGKTVCGCLHMSGAFERAG